MLPFGSPRAASEGHRHMGQSTLYRVLSFYGLFAINLSICGKVGVHEPGTINSALVQRSRDVGR
jgi:hypothetical protein